MSDLEARALATTQLIFSVEDCHRSDDMLRAEGADYPTEPLGHPGETRALFRDPDGHLFEISEPTD